MDRLLEENSEASSSGTDNDFPIKSPKYVQGKRKTNVKKSYDSPAANIAVLMVACWTMRIPIIYTDLIK
jgi:RNA polymerase I-specific transcription initiation factor RRN7